MRVRAPTVVSFSTSEPRPTTTPSPSVAALAHAGLVADDDAAPEAAAGEDDGAGQDRACRPRRRAAGRSSPLAVERAPSVGVLADDGVVADHDALPEHGPRVDDRALGDASAQTRSRSSDAWSCSSARTTATPVAGRRERVALAAHEARGSARTRGAAARRSGRAGCRRRRCACSTRRRCGATARRRCRRRSPCGRAPCRRRRPSSSIPPPSAAGPCGDRARRGGLRGDPRGKRSHEGDVLDPFWNASPPPQPAVLAQEVQHDRDVVGAEAPQRVLVFADRAQVHALP